MSLRGFPVLLLCICSSLAISCEATNQRFAGQGMGRMGMGDHRSGLTLKDARDKGLVATGLKPRHVEGNSCPGIASEFASPYRYDGSKRPRFRNAGLHAVGDVVLE